MIWLLSAILVVSALDRMDARAHRASRAPVDPWMVVAYRLVAFLALLAVVLNL